MRKLNSHTILQLWCCCHAMYKLLYPIPSIRVRTAPSVSVSVRVRVNVNVSVRVRVNVSFSLIRCNAIAHTICMCPRICRIHSPAGLSSGWLRCTSHRQLEQVRNKQKTSSSCMA